MATAFGASVFIITGLIALLIFRNLWIAILIGVAAAVGWLSAAWFKATNVVLDLSEVEPASESDHARLFNVCAGMCVTVGTSAPDIYVVEDSALNAMAVGRNPRSAALVVTTGLLEELTLIELEAVVAFELLRIKLLDTAPETYVVPTVGAAAVLGEAADRWQWLQRILFAPMPLIERVLVWLYAGRKDVSLDVATVSFTQYPPALASALEKMDGKSALAMGTPVTAHLWMAPPLGLRASTSLSKIHVPLAERVAVLREL